MHTTPEASIVASREANFCFYNYAEHSSLATKQNVQKGPELSSIVLPYSLAHTVNPISFLLSAMETAHDKMKLFYEAGGNATMASKKAYCSKTQSSQKKRQTNGPVSPFAVARACIFQHYTTILNS
jgi:hypothetical protein